MKVEKNNLVSVIVPVYNTEKYLDRCLNSIINQTYKQLEIILIDDGSKDSSGLLCDKYANIDNRIRVIHQKNKGIAETRNIGIKNVNGQYVCFIDSDDYIEKDYIQNLYNSIIDNNSDYAVCDIKRIYDDKETYEIMTPYIIDTCQRPAPWNKLYKIKLFRNNNIKFIKGIWYEDLNTISKITLLNKYSIVNGTYYNYIQNNSSIMHSYNNKIFDIYCSIEDLEKYARKNKCNIKKLEFINIYHILIGTIYRASYLKEFNIKHIKEISKYVSNKYPRWYKNDYIKDLSPIYRIYLLFIRFNLNFLLFISLKLFNKKIHL